MQELPQYQVLRKYGQHASNFENYPKEILENSAGMRKPGLPLTMMMAPGLEHELGFLYHARRDLGARRQELATIRDK